MSKELVIEEIERFVAYCLDGYKCKIPKKGKLIHDPIWGTMTLNNWELVFLDSPLLQRLRGIHQTGLAYLVYPSATHTRFDHTLGVLNVVQQIADNINANRESVSIDKKDLYNLRMAALLHDVGHCIFSHASEAAVCEIDSFKTIKSHIIEEYNLTSTKPHEVMSWAILNSKVFRKFFSKVRREIEDKDVRSSLDVDSIGKFIIGYWRDKPEKRYLVDIINGSLDADKLDYIARDAYFAGLSVKYDIHRYMKTIYVGIREELGRKDIVQLLIPLSGITALQQIVISKLFLYQYLYHHQKVRAAEGMLIDLLHNIVRCKPEYSNIGELDICRTLDGILKVTEDYIVRWTNIKKDNQLSSLSGRYLLKRALIISKLYIEGIKKYTEVRCTDEDESKSMDGFGRLYNECKDVDGILKIRDKIYYEALKIIKCDRKKKGFSKDCIWVDLPRFISVKESQETIIPLTTESDSYIEFGKVFPLNEWADTYSDVLWKGHIFATDKYRQEVYEASINVLGNEPYFLKFSEEARELCKISYDEIEITLEISYDELPLFEGIYTKSQ